jgi:hypothetical protein
VRSHWAMGQPCLAFNMSESVGMSVGEAGHAGLDLVAGRLAPRGKEWRDVGARGEGGAPG